MITKHTRTRLVLLPGLDGTGELFAPFISALPNHLARHIVAYPKQALNLEALAEYVINRLPEGEIILLAESFSGLVALTLLAQDHAPIKGVIFCAAFASSPRPWLVHATSRLPFLQRLFRFTPDALMRHYCLDQDASASQIDLLRSIVLSVPEAVLSQRLRLIEGFKPSIGKPLKLPCYFLQADGDRLVPPQAASWFRDHFEPFQLQRIEGPHFLLQSNPSVCAKGVMAILDEWERSGYLSGVDTSPRPD
jgi:pimeloyl-ACP methyl ester carboxylesterase